MMNKEKEAIDNISTGEDMSKFLMLSAKNNKEKPAEWQNTALYDYLESISACLKDLPGLEKNLKVSIPENIDWKFIATLLLAGKYYE